DAEQDQRDHLARRDLGETRRTNEGDKGKGVDAQRKYEVVDEIKILAAAQVKNRQQKRVERQEQKKGARQPIGQRPVQRRRIGHQPIQPRKDFCLPPACRRIFLLASCLERIQQARLRSTGKLGMNAAEAHEKVTLGRIGEVASRLVRFFFRKRNGLGKIFGVRVARIISGVGQEGVALRVVDDLDGFGFHLQLQDRDTGQRKENEKNQRHEEIEANGRHVSLRAPFAK